jgi:hypothetical protein
MGEQRTKRFMELIRNYLKDPYISLDKGTLVKLKSNCVCVLRECRKKSSSYQELSQMIKEIDSKSAGILETEKSIFLESDQSDQASAQADPPPNQANHLNADSTTSALKLQTLLKKQKVVSLVFI